MTPLWQDARYAVRTLGRSRAFTLVMVVTLALGIGVNTAVFTLFNAFVLKPVPVPDPATLVHVKRVDPEGGRENLLSYAAWRELREGNASLVDLAAYNKAIVSVAGGAEGEARRTAALLVTSGYFSLLGARPEVGRLLTAEDESAAGASPVVVLSHAYWERRFGGDPRVVGRTIDLQGRPFLVVGVTARGFVGTQPDAPEFFVPLVMRDQLIGPGGWLHRTWYAERDAHAFLVLGRLRPGISRERAELDLGRIATVFFQGTPDAERAATVALTSAASLVELDASFLPLILPIALALLLILLAACANVANLALARAAGRQREIAVRLSLGASRGRLIRQLLTESALVGLAGGVVGLLVAERLIALTYPRVLARLPEFYRYSFSVDLAPDARVFGFTFLLALATGVLFGLAPALRSSRSDLGAAMKGASSLLGPRRSSARLRDGLLVAQVATSVILLVAAGLLTHGLLRLRQVDTGFSARGVLSVEVGWTGFRSDPARELELRRRLIARARELPAVTSVTEARRQPLAGRPPLALVRLPEGGAAATAGVNWVDGDYFRTMELPLLRGRAITGMEARAGAPVVVVSDAAARRLWPGQNPLGKRIAVGAPGAATDADRPMLVAEVVGVAADARNGWLWEPDRSFLYLPLPPPERRDAHLLVRTTDPRGTSIVLRREAAVIDPRIHLSSEPLQASLDLQMQPFEAAALAASVIGLLALLLACSGVYGVASYLVRQRVREMGIRVALGARRDEMVRLVLGWGLRPVALGAALGLLGAAASAQLVRAALVGLSPLDPGAYLAATAILGVVALLASLGPARWAARIDPMVVLRQD